MTDFIECQGPTASDPKV